MAESKFRLVIKIDPEKVKKYGYVYEEVVAAVEEICEDYHCIKKDDGIFTGRGLNTDIGEVYKASVTLCRSDWFRKCVKSIEWFAPREEYIDLIKYHTEKGLVFG